MTTAFANEDWNPEDDVLFFRYMEELDEIPPTLVEDFLALIDEDEARGTE